MRNLKDSHEPGQHPTPVRAWRTGLLGTLGIVAAIAGVPIPYLTLNTVGPTIMRFGSDEQ